MELQNLIWENHLKKNEGELSQLKPPNNIDADVTLYSENQELLKQWMQSEISQAYWSTPSLNNWYQLKTKDQTWFTEELEDRFIYRHIRQVSIGNMELFLEVFSQATPYASGAINDIIAQDQNTRFLTESEDLVRGYYSVSYTHLRAHET